MKDLKAKIKIQDDTPGRSLASPEESAREAAEAFRNPAVDADVSHEGDGVWSVRFGDKRFTIEAAEAEAVIEIPLTWSSLWDVLEGTEYASKIDLVLNEADIETDSYVM